MAEADMQTEQTIDKPADAARRTADAAVQTTRKAADAGADMAQTGVEAERRSFASAADAGRQGAETMGRAAQSSLRAGKDMARHSQDIARRASDQAVEFWRASLTPMTQMQNEFSHFLGRVWSQASPIRAPGSLLPGLMMGPLAAMPAADLQETDQGMELCVELPGLKADDIDLSIKGGMLVLSGEKGGETARREGTYHVTERRFGRFERSFPLPPTADQGKIEARFEDGLLRVAIPTTADGQDGRQIPVKG